MKCICRRQEEEHGFMNQQYTHVFHVKRYMNSEQWKCISCNWNTKWIDKKRHSLLPTHAIEILREHVGNDLTEMQ